MNSDKSSDSREEEEKPTRSKRTIKHIDYSIKNIQNMYYGG